MASSYVAGNGVVLTATYTNPSGALYDPAAVFFTITPPTPGAKTTAQYGQAPPAGYTAPVRSSLGVYQWTLTNANLLLAGDYWWSSDDGNNLVANEAVFSITSRRAGH